MRHDGWTPDEDARLRALYPTVGAKGAAGAIGRTVNATKSRVQILGLAGNRRRPRTWTAERDRLLRATYAEGGLAAAAQALDLSRSAVKNRVQQLGLKRPARLWTAEEDAFVRAHYGRDMRSAAIGEHIGRSMQSVCRRAYLLGVRAARLWTAAEKEAVRTGYASRGAKALAVELLGSADDLNQKAIRALAFKLGVTVPFRHPKWVYERVRELHVQGLFDGQIAAAMSDYFPGRNDRERVTAIRTRMGLPAIKQDRLKSVRGQCATLGISHPWELKTRAHERLAARYGLPEDLRVRQVQIVLALASGPKTKTELGAELGIRKTSWQLNRPKGASRRSDPGLTRTYLSDLVHRGLVLGAAEAGPRGGPALRYTLTPLALSLLSQHKEQSA